MMILHDERAIDNWHGFKVKIDRTPFDPKYPDISGYTRSGPLVRVGCSSQINICSFWRRFGPSEFTFNLPRKEVEEAVGLSERIAAMLEKHRVPRGTQP
jgi:hypothetical protein